MLLHVHMYDIWVLFVFFPSYPYSLYFPDVGERGTAILLGRNAFQRQAVFHTSDYAAQHQFRRLPLMTSSGKNLSGLARRQPYLYHAFFKALATPVRHLMFMTFIGFSRDILK